jgi:hypothetical protein
MNNIGGNITLTNIQDNNRQFQLTGLLANEVITINNDLQIITSSLGLPRLSNFNLNWFRLLPNLNTILVQGNISNLSMTYYFDKKIGG